MNLQGRSNLMAYVVINAGLGIQHEGIVACGGLHVRKDSDLCLGTELGRSPASGNISLMLSIPQARVLRIYGSAIHGHEYVETWLCGRGISHARPAQQVSHLLFVMSRY
jgi:hypothetical protein